jgi:hypothetical protein
MVEQLVPVSTNLPPVSFVGGGWVPLFNMVDHDLPINDFSINYPGL